MNELNPYITNLDTRRAAMLQYMDGLSEGDLKRAPRPKAWSPLEVLEHIIIVEEMTTKANRPKAGEDRVGMKARIFMVVGVGPMRPGFRIPTMPMLLPKRNHDYDALKERWTEARRTLAAQVEAVKTESQHRAMVVHPLAGPMSAAMALDFLDVHLRYHWKNFPRVSK